MYDDSQDEMAHLTVDLVLFARVGVKLYVLLVTRKWDPFEGFLAFPGGHVKIGEDTNVAAQRELFEETGVTANSLVEFGAYTAPGRDSRGRTVTVVYTWTLDSCETTTAGDDASEAQWYPVSEMLTDDGCARLAFDHAQILNDVATVFIHGIAL